MRRLSNHLLLLLSVLLWAGCTKEDVAQAPSVSASVTIISIDDIRTDDLHIEAKAYYDLLAQSILATDSHLDLVADTANPLSVKLHSLVLMDDQDVPVSLSSLSEEQVRAFLNDWGNIESLGMSAKIQEVPELAEDLASYNDAVRYALDTETFTRSGEVKVTDKKSFFNCIQERYEENLAVAAETRISNGGGEHPVPTHVVLQKLQSYGRPGDFLVRLPKHGCEYSYLDYTGKEFSVGHSAIITQAVRTNDSGSKEFAIGAQTSGVVNENIHYWSYKSYIMGIQNVRWRIKWNWFKTTTYKEITPVSNPAALAAYAARFKGKSYVKAYEFLIAKWMAPTRFICTTLIWYSADKVYGIDISEWYKTVVSPSGLLRSENTYIRAVIE